MTQYDDIVVTPVYGPLSTNQYPNVMPKHNYGVLIGRHPNPPQFRPADNSSESALARYQYFRTASLQNTPLAQSTKYIAPAPSSLYVSARKRLAVGKASYRPGVPNYVPMSYKSYDRNDVKTALRIVRGGGCVAPKKKGAIENYSLRNGASCAWGSLVRQNY